MRNRPLVLIVDDEPEILQTIRRRLRVEGMEAETAQDPCDAINRMQEVLHPIAVCDIKMPGMSGIELLQEIKRVNPMCNVIMMTGYSSMLHVVDCLGRGAVDYFVKPFQDIDELVEAICAARKRVERWQQAMPLEKKEVNINAW